MITGFNTDVEHAGVVYHVQTEDKGLNTPLILSLVYSGGAILASKRSPYEDLISSGFNEEVLAERLKRQHRLICAAIRAGRLDELKQMGAREPNAEKEETQPLPEAPRELEAEPAALEFVSNAQDEPAPIPPPEEDETLSDAGTQSVQEVGVATPARRDAAPYVVFDSRRQDVFGGSEPQEGLCVTLLDEQEFRSGTSLTLAVLVTHRSPKEEKPLSGVSVSVKVLGTTFRPVIVSLKTQRDGVALVNTKIPQFSSGRAAILVRAVKGGESVEIRRVVHPA